MVQASVENDDMVGGRAGGGWLGGG
jgi:hypothetical protein